MNKRKITACAVLTAVLFSACSRDKIISCNGPVTGENVTQVSALLREAGLSHTEEFEEWVRKTDETETEGFSGADCRMTVFLLAGDQITYDSTEEIYDGDILMFDLDAIGTDPAYSMLKEKEDLFTTLFGEMPVPEKGYKEALPERWKQHGIRFGNEKCSLISIVFQAYGAEKVFVGHTGILIDCRDKDNIPSDYVFVEKISFTDPFMITPVKDENELISILSARPDYTVEEGEYTPQVYRNDVWVGELK